MMDGMLESRRGQTHMEHFQATTCKDCTCATSIRTLSDFRITIMCDTCAAKRHTPVTHINMDIDALTLSLELE